MDYTLARMSLRDIRAVYCLEQEIFPQDAYPYVDLILLLLAPRMINIKAVQNGALVGFIALADAWFPFNPAWVITLGVGKAYQNRGIGRCLLRTVESQLHSPRLRLTVRRGNSAAIHLYQTSGYEIYQTIPRYYRDGEDGLVMEKWLSV